MSFRKWIERISTPLDELSKDTVINELHKWVELLVLSLDSPEPVEGPK
jgi:hypothetical protein